MNSIRNRVRLIGNVGNAPEVKEVGKNRIKKVMLSLATNEYRVNDAGEKSEDTQWHHVVAFGKLAELMEKYVTKGKELAVEGKLVYHNYEDSAGNKKFITEILADEFLLLGK